MLLAGRQDLWQPRQPSTPTKRKTAKIAIMTKSHLIPFHLLAIAMCFFLVSGLFAIVDWLSRMWGMQIIPDDAPWWTIPAATVGIYPLLYVAYKEEVEG